MCCGQDTSVDGAGERGRFGVIVGGRSGRRRRERRCARSDRTPAHDASREGTDGTQAWRADRGRQLAGRGHPVGRRHHVQAAARRADRRRRRSSSRCCSAATCGDVLAGDLREMLFGVGGTLMARPLALASYLLGFLLVLVGRRAADVPRQGRHGGGPRRAPTARPARSSARRSGSAGFRRAMAFSIERSPTGRPGCSAATCCSASCSASSTSSSAALCLFDRLRPLPAGRRPSAAARVGGRARASCSSSRWSRSSTCSTCWCRSSWPWTTAASARALRGVARFVRGEFWKLSRVFGVTVLLLLLATLLSVVATWGFYLIAYVPLAGLIVLPAATGRVAASQPGVPVPRADGAVGLSVPLPRLRADGAPAAGVVPPPDERRHDRLRPLLLEGRVEVAGVGHPQDGRDGRARARHDLVRAGLPGSRRCTRGRSSATSRPSCSTARDALGRCSTGRRAATGRWSRPASRSSATRGITAGADQVMITTGSQQGIDLVGKVAARSRRRRAGGTAGLHRRHQRVQERRGRAGRRPAAGRRHRSRGPRSRRRAGAGRRAGRSGSSTSCRTSRTRRACCSRSRSASRCSSGPRGPTCSSSKTTRTARSTSTTRRPRPTRGRSRRTTTRGGSIYLSSFSKTLAPGLPRRVDGRAGADRREARRCSSRRRT